MDRIDVTDWLVVGDESMGADPKIWIAPGPMSDSPSLLGADWLFKSAKTGNRHDGQTYRRHDDVAEAVVCEVAKLLELPTAPVHLAVRDGIQGIISRNVIRKEHTSRSGDLVLLGTEGYVSCAGTRTTNERPGHNLTNIALVLEGLKGPAESNYEPWSAFDVFSGYLLLDALCANNDRHAENWAIEIPPLGDAKQPDRLAASFDHGSSLASAVEDDVCDKKLSAVSKFCRAGKAKRFEDRKQSLVELWYDSLKQSDRFALTWLEHLAKLDVGKVAEVCHDIDVVSDARATLMTAIIEENKRRILQCALQN
ncbi:hypothetical protein QYM46_02750 [Brevibacterium sp. K11IcPPYGO002]|uniref:hypothetical protein n=1 Tax=Brevibacterium sp. K11IcPPYGO002 TaxID=3058837 RepID=UPI003D81AF38